MSPDGWALDRIDLAIIRAVRELSGSSRSPVRTSSVLGELQARESSWVNWPYRLGRLAAPWMVSVPLLDPIGNVALRGVPPADPSFTEVSLTPAGRLAATHGRVLPLLLMNGGRSSPGFDPLRVLQVVHEVMADPSMSSRAMLSGLGSPSSPDGCAIDLDLDRLSQGLVTAIAYRSRWRLIETNAIEVRDLHHDVDPGQALAALVRARDLVEHVQDRTTGGQVSIVASVRPGVGREEVIAALGRRFPFSVRRTAWMRFPLSLTVRHCAEVNRVDPAPIEQLLGLLGRPRSAADGFGVGGR